MLAVKKLALIYLKVNNIIHSERNMAKPRFLGSQNIVIDGQRLDKKINKLKKITVMSSPHSRGGGQELNLVHTPRLSILKYYFGCFFSFFFFTSFHVVVCVLVLSCVRQVIFQVFLIFYRGFKMKFVLKDCEEYSCELVHLCPMSYLFNGDKFLFAEKS